jgi:hypothetical protein
VLVRLQCLDFEHDRLPAVGALKVEFFKHHV